MGSSPLLGPYAATRSAAWSFTTDLRQELAGQGTQVLGLHVGFMDTDMARGVEFAKADPTCSKPSSRKRWATSSRAW
ncbi:hypothetical protein [Vitiosangium sp. GDMCC 1.1324]|uniref:hypothetical protein n=1 Tax=Vitiosangium sp. (strain GDMCC 1.1324) TaxID=2138576 RepID=UPI000D3399BB|nr:hypothetical protein [Vitiosangium sp. GDMCC 1.1324]PTL75077.1 hypothetical protein DAT35_56860 [Vitiosangium sp. GDMCC 1.1324]